MNSRVILTISSAILCTVAFEARSDTITVINTNDSGLGSLRQALAIANDGDTIYFDSSLNGQVITLTSGELVIGKNIAIIGLGPDLLTVSRAQNAANFRIFHVTSGHTVTIEGLTISNGNAQGNFPGAAGGGIYSELSALSVNDCVITSNTALWGGGICNYGNASGAMIYLSNSSISSNLGLNAAGGIYNYSQGAFSSASLTVSNSTVNGNSSVEAGGIYNKTANGSDTLAINNSTISGNSANLTGGIENYAIGTNATATLTIANSTLSSNSAVFKGGSAITNGGGTNGRDSPSAQSQATLGNTILNSDGSSPNIFNSPGGIITSNGYNISNDDGSGYLTGPGDQINTDPILGPLQGNGGPTFTHALLPGSPAIDAGDPKFTPPPLFDQRGSGFAAWLMGGSIKARLKCKDLHPRLRLALHQLRRQRPVRQLHLLQLPQLLRAHRLPREQLLRRDCVQLRDRVQLQQARRDICQRVEDNAFHLGSECCDW